MKTYVVPLRGNSRGLVGYIMGSLVERQENGPAVGLFKTAVHFPGQSHPKDFRIMQYDNLREATALEIEMMKVMG